MVGEKKVNGIQYAEALALCAGKCTLPTGLSGRGELSCHDLLMALAKADVPDVARRLVRWKCMGDSGGMETLKELRSFFGLPDALMGSAIWEWLSPAICLTCCGGRANYAHLDSCPTCHGTGMAPKRHAPPVGLSPKEWEEWEPQYQSAIDRMHDLTRLACIQAAALLTEPENAEPL